jgi:hypothetical protein
MMFYLPNPILMLFLMEINVLKRLKINPHRIERRMKNLTTEITMKRLNVLKWRIKLDLHTKKTHLRCQKKPEIVKNETKEVLKT